jgi:hypothetical protein
MGASQANGLGSPEGPEPHSGLRPAGAIPSAETTVASCPQCGVPCPVSRAIRAHEDGSMTLDNPSVQRLMDLGVLHYTEEGWHISKWPWRVSAGCVCPPNTERSCRASLCPRKPISW